MILPTEAEYEKLRHHLKKNGVPIRYEAGLLTVSDPTGAEIRIVVK